MRVDTVAAQRSRPARSGSGSARRPGLLRRIVLYVVLALLAVPFVYPLLWMLFSTFKPTSEIYGAVNLWPRRWTLEAFGTMFEANPLLQQYWNSLYISATVTVVVVVLASAAGYAFARVRFPGANALFLVVVSTIFLPIEVTIIPIFRWTSDLGLLDTHWPLIVPMALGPRLATAVFIYRQFYLTFPRELEEAASIDGLRRFATYRRVIVPLSGAPTGTVVILTFLFAFNSYLEPLVFIQSPELLTVGVGITRYQDQYGEPLYNAQLGAASLSVVPVLIVFLFAQRKFVESLASSGLKG